jgi:Leucine-rich repeat (LRR) protein
MDLELVEYKGIQIRKNEAEVLYAIEEQINREFSVNRRNYYFSRHASMEVRISNNKVWKLGLYNCGLKKLPDSIERLTSIQELYLGRNNLTDLPESFINLLTLLILISLLISIG